MAKRSFAVCFVVFLLEVRGFYSHIKQLECCNVMAEFFTCFTRLTEGRNGDVCRIGFMLIFIRWGAVLTNGLQYASLCYCLTALSLTHLIVVLIESLSV